MDSVPVNIGGAFFRCVFMFCSFFIYILIRLHIKHATPLYLCVCVCFILMIMHGGFFDLRFVDLFVFLKKNVSLLCVFFPVDWRS